MTPWSRKWGLEVALVAVVLLVLQSVASALALGSGVSSQPLDVFGNPLCITSSDQPHDGSHDGGHSTLPECCMLGCNMFSPALTAPSPETTAFLRLPLVTDGRIIPFDTALLADSDHDPGNPRAPPLTA